MSRKEAAPVDDAPVFHSGVCPAGHAGRTTKPCNIHIYIYIYTYVYKYIYIYIYMSPIPLGSI